MRPTYDPTTPSRIIWTPLVRSRRITMNVQPSTTVAGWTSRATKTHTMSAKLAAANRYPIRVMSRKGTVEKLMMPSAANLSILRRG
ncbi:Uncharacterised protein [Mycobacteroides abscessus]|nr:Uncharacterised protein [Mycobacteroides abscessus]